jgi:hypothetical protein
MPTINEVWEQALQINANLASIHNDMNACCQAEQAQLTSLQAQVGVTNQRLAELEAIANAGFSAMAAGFAASNARQDLTNQILLYQAQQGETLICLLEKIARHTCGTWNEETLQTGLERRLVSHAEALAHMFATSHADAALVYDRHRDDQAKLERCCPPPADRLPCQDEAPCPKPERPRFERPEPYGGYQPPRREEPGGVKTAKARGSKG